MVLAEVIDIKDECYVLRGPNSIKMVIRRNGHNFIVGDMLKYYNKQFVDAGKILGQLAVIEPANYYFPIGYVNERLARTLLKLRHQKNKVEEVKKFVEEYVGQSMLEDKVDEAAIKLVKINGLKWVLGNGFRGQIAYGLRNKILSFDELLRIDRQFDRNYEEWLKEAQ